MKFTHPEGTHDIIAVPGTQLLGEVTQFKGGVSWITIGVIGHTDKIMVERDEWEAFKTLIAEIDEALK